MIRRRCGVALLGVGFLVGTVACSGAGTSGSSSDSLRYGYDLGAQFTNTFDVKESGGDCDQIPLSLIYDTLLRQDHETKEITPGLVTEWTVEGDAKRTITMKVRPNVKFTDGTPLTADVIKSGLLRNKQNDQLTSLLFIESIDVLDPLTLRINMTNDQSTPLLYSLAERRDGMIMSPKSYKNATTQPVGTGPFMLDSFQPGKGITLKKNPNYWEAGTYDFPGVEFVNAGTGPPSVTQFRADNIDLVRFEAESIDTLKSTPHTKVVVQPSEAYLQLQFRQVFKDGTKTPFANELVRKAVRYAIDTKQINEIVQKGLGEVANQDLPKDSPGYNPDVADAYPYSPEKARELLTQAGYPDGFEFTMAIPGPGIKNMADQGALIQDQLKQVGITAKIKPILGSDIATQYYISGDGDAFAAAHLASSFYPGVYYDQYAKFQFVPIWNGVERSDIDDLTLRAQATRDEAETAALTKQAAKIVSDEALEVPIAFMPQFLAYNTDRVGGTVGGQTDICNPPDLSKVTMKTKG